MKYLNRVVSASLWRHKNQPWLKAASVCLLGFIFGLLVCLEASAQKIQAIRMDPALAVRYGLQPVETEVQAPSTTELSTQEVQTESAAVVGSTSTLAEERFQAVMQVPVDRLSGTILKELAKRSIQPIPNERSSSSPLEDTAGAETDVLVDKNNLDEEKSAQRNPAAPWIHVWSDEKWRERLGSLSTEITLGRWSDVQDFTQGIALEPEQSTAFYERLLQALSMAPPTPETQRLQQILKGAVPVIQSMSLDDIIQLAEIAPSQPLTPGQIEGLGNLLGQGIETGAIAEPEVLEKLTQGFAGIGGETGKDQALALLLAAGQVNAVGDFLNKNGVQDIELSALEQQAGFAWLKSREAPEDPALLQTAWDWSKKWFRRVSDNGVLDEDSMGALNLLAQILPELPEKQSAKWLEAEFARSPNLSLFLLSQAGVKFNQMQLIGPPEQRIKLLKEINLYIQSAVQTQAVEVQEDLKNVISLTALHWLKEAELAIRQGVVTGPQNMYARMDAYGNVYYENYNNRNNNPNGLNPLDAESLIQLAPEKVWAKWIQPSLWPKIRGVRTELMVLSGEPEIAAEAIEELHHEWEGEAYRLANELIRSWPRRFNPAQYRGPNIGSARLINPYARQAANGIPMTRLIQERHLKRLTEVLQKLEGIPFIKPLDSDAIAKAFVATHSPAEVFDIKDIEATLGSVNQWAPEIFYVIAQEMRSRLATTWRDPQTQQTAKRKPADIQEEILRGYSALEALIGGRLAEVKTDWRAMALEGMSQFDLAEYEYGLEFPLQEYTARRDRAFRAFEAAAELYRKALPGMMVSDYSIEVYQQWFNANLGASDLGYLTRQQVPDQSRLALLGQALYEIPDPYLEWHLQQFGEALSGSVQQIQPELKPRYLRSGIEVIGSHPSAEAARELVFYYDSLLAEIDFSAYLDGSSDVGNQNPFGLFLTLRHTSDIEREAGGFSKYLQNQQSAAVNYYARSGAVNYRNDLENSIISALDESFETVSMTFQDPQAPSRNFGKPGWRETPLAYVVLKAKDAAVDTIPGIQLDLDFVDETGQVILPVETSPILIDARSENVPTRPVSDLEVTLLLDEREWSEGKLILEIEAKANGIIGELETFLNPELEGFQISEIEDTGLAMDRLDSTGADLAAVTERRWIVEYEVAGDSANAENSEKVMGFRYPQPLENSPVVGEIKLAYKRYQDADIVDVDPEVALAETGLEVGQKSWWRSSWQVGLALLLGVSVLIFSIWAQQPVQIPDASASEWQIPDRITPFNLSHILTRMLKHPGFEWSEDERKELITDIDWIESSFFKDESSERSGASGAEATTPDELGDLLHKWLSRVNWV